MGNVEKSFLRAVSDFSMIEGGDRILIAASGGKDSTVMTFLLSGFTENRKTGPGLRALKVINPRVEERDAGREEALGELYARWGIPLDYLETDAAGDTAETEKAFGCYRCASLRRAGLMDYALQNGCNKIAFGHHLDDVLTTYLMNMLGRGDAQAMRAVRRYDSFGITLIRPLVYTTEESIRRFAERAGWPTQSCACPWAGGDGDRARYRRKLEELCGGSLETKRKMLKGLLDLGLV